MHICKQAFRCSLLVVFFLFVVKPGSARIGFASWPRDRLFGFSGESVGNPEIELPPSKVPLKLKLNYETLTAEGNLRVELLDKTLKLLTDCSRALVGSGFDSVIMWDGDTEIKPHSRPIYARIHLDEAAVYAFELDVVH